MAHPEAKQTLPEEFSQIIVEFETPKAISEGELLPEESQLIAGSTSPERRQNFTAGRIAARRALARLIPGTTPGPVLRGESNEPLFPIGVRGSISHCDHLACAVVTSHPQIIGVGVDLEARNRTINSRVVERITSPTEREFYRLLDSAEKNLWIKVFCAKEALFKACFPVILREFSFQDIDVLFSSATEAKLHLSERLEDRLREKCPRNWKLNVDFREHKGKVVAIAAITVSKVWA